ncbi:DNA-binding response regulator [Aphanothece hegewaldii CCALA 016]|uniref:DNA-binding response regulator n=1 Tax=Aphanothece hegewaldii CCALA 016 TaxID=2107694 RepID=A0A2T1LUP4_9CHRO|nr:response regulator transcription factor [Aphanothece hegewaldii]PSF35288.1 DNA-binding response regulator [Aphanothece hegewaldii CCALA 016]
MRILIVEDDPLMQLGLQQALSNHAEFEIVGLAKDGYAGVKMALELKPDLVIMDLGLPRLDGIAATKTIKEQCPDIRIVILTSHTLETEVIASLSSGADAYCIKGSSLERLETAIFTAIDGATYLDPQIARLVVENLKQPTPQANFKIGLLSSREMDVLKLIVEGKSNLEIAEKLYLSPNTIKTHVRGIMNKLAVDDRVQAAVVALRSGIV